MFTSVLKPCTPDMWKSLPHSSKRRYAEVALTGAEQAHRKSHRLLPVAVAVCIQMPDSDCIFSKHTCLLVPGTDAPLQKVHVQKQDREGCPPLWHG